MADVGDLREKAEAATPGPWQDGPWRRLVVDTAPDLDYIAAWHPGVALAALRVIEAAEALKWMRSPVGRAILAEQVADALDAALRDFREAK